MKLFSLRKVLLVVMTTVMMGAEAQVLSGLGALGQLFSLMQGGGQGGGGGGGGSSGGGIGAQLLEAYQQQMREQPAFKIMAALIPGLQNFNGGGSNGGGGGGGDSAPAQSAQAPRYRQIARFPPQFENFNAINDFSTDFLANHEHSADESQQMNWIQNQQFNGFDDTMMTPQHNQHHSHQSHHNNHNDY